MTLQLDRPLVVLDTETTGTEDYDEIISIAVIRIDPGHAPEKSVSYIQPYGAIPPESTKVHGITDAMVANAPRFADLWQTDIRALVQGADVCAYNAAFDLGMIDRELARAALPKWDRSTVRILDPYVIFRTRLPHKLTGAVEYYLGDTTFGERAHQADADAQAAFDVLMAQMKRYGFESFEAAAQASIETKDDRYLDSGRWFTSRFGVPHFAKGKNKGRPIDKDPGYLDWMMRQSDLSEDTRAIVEDAYKATRKPTPALSGFGSRGSYR